MPLISPVSHLTVPSQEVNVEKAPTNLISAQGILSKDPEHNPEPLSKRTVQQANSSSSILKTWEIVLCAISIIGLLVLLGVCLGRKKPQNSLQQESTPPLQPVSSPMPPVGIQKPVVATVTSKPITSAWKPYFAGHEEIKKRMLAAHPSWEKMVNTWQGVCVIEQVFILELFELRELGIKLDPFEMVLKYAAGNDAEIPSLINRPLIENALSKVTKLEVKNVPLKSQPEALGLLKNLKELIFENNGMETLYLNSIVNLKTLRVSKNALVEPPYVGDLKNLEVLCLPNNKLKEAPHLGDNVHLKILDLSDNELTEAPNLTSNRELRDFSIANNKLTELPYLGYNGNLNVLYCPHNQLFSLPNLSQNVQLRHLLVHRNQITALPDLDQNIRLERLEASNNKLTVTPDLKKNPELQAVLLNANQLTNAPDVSANPKLQSLRLENNPLTKEAKKALKKLTSDRKGITNLKFDT